MDVLQHLEVEHRMVSELLASLSASKAGADRNRSLRSLTAVIEAHMAFEERFIHPLVEHEVEVAMAEEAYVEHDLTRTAFAVMVELAAQPGFVAAVEMVKGGFEYHLEEEERLVFPALRATAAEGLAALAHRFPRTLVLADDEADAILV